MAKSLLWAGATSVVVLLASFWWEYFYLPVHGSWIVLPSGVRCPPVRLPAGIAWLFSAVRAAQTFVIVFVVALLVTNRRRNR
jgi:hypothetical protein